MHDDERARESLRDAHDDGRAKRSSTTHTTHTTTTAAQSEASTTHTVTSRAKRSQHVAGAWIRHAFDVVTDVNDERVMAMTKLDARPNAALVVR